MNDWTKGYVAGIGYTYGYYNELNPMATRLAFLNAGIVAPKIATACELGFGQGLSTSIHAAASPVRWYGTDFNPAQASFARSLTTASGSTAQLFDDSFAEFAQRKDLPDFDFIGLHGIWSWVNDENRHIIVDFIHRKLKVGGVLYASYNTEPGRAAFIPMRNLLTQHAKFLGSEGQGITGRIDGAIDFATRFLETNPWYSKANPTVSDRFKKLKDQSRDYLAHEYFNRDWQSMYFSEIAEWFKTAKLEFACSANYLDFADEINLTEDQQIFLKTIPDQVFRETVRDFMVNQQFRRDYWVKGLRPLSHPEKSKAMRALKVVLVNHQATINFKLTTCLGEVTMNESIYKTILEVLADYQPKSIADIEVAIRGKGINDPQLVQSLLLLVGLGHLQAVQDDTAIEKARETARQLDTHFMEMAGNQNEVNYLASPVTGGGHAVTRFQQLFLRAIREGKHDPQQMVNYVWEILSIYGQKLLKEGKVLETELENLAELRVFADEFIERRLPVLQALQIS